MSPEQEKIAGTAALVGIGLAGGTASAIAGTTPLHLHHAGAAGPASSVAFGFIDALKHHKTLSQALGAGLTGLVGTHAAGAVAAGASVAMTAAPFVLVGGAVALAGYGLFKAFEAASSEPQQPKETVP